VGTYVGDEKLLRYLYEHKHLTPFEMCGLTIEVQAPIFVFREWHRHRTQSYNELSARYTELPNLFYIPDNERLMAAKQSKKNKQGSEDGFTDVDAG
jgi:thymidylate synthase (FAD)